MKCYDCESPIIPYRMNLERDYKTVRLILKDFPVYVCVACDTYSYGAGSMIKYLTEAKKNYDSIGQTILNCN